MNENTQTPVIDTASPHLDNHAPKVSVTVVTYNHGKWLADCLDSILTQKTDFSFEIIVGDDASTDSLTKEILADYAKKYPKIIKPVFRGSNLGPTANYLDVVSRVAGEYVAHIDGDDLMLPGKLQRQADYLDEQRDVVMVGHQADCIDKNGKVVGKFQKSNQPQKFDINTLLKRHAVFPHSSIMYRSERRHQFKYEGIERLDIYTYLLIASSGRIGYLRESLGLYRRHVGIATKGFPATLQGDVIKLAVALGLSQSAVRTYEAKLQLAHAYASWKGGDISSYGRATRNSLRLKIYSVEQIKFFVHYCLYVLRKGL